jgi:hypothetical protein
MYAAAPVEQEQDDKEGKQHLIGLLEEGLSLSTLTGCPMTPCMMEKLHPTDWRVRMGQALSGHANLRRLQVVLVGSELLGDVPDCFLERLPQGLEVLELCGRTTGYHGCHVELLLDRLMPLDRVELNYVDIWGTDAQIRRAAEGVGSWTVRCAEGTLHDRYPHMLLVHGNVEVWEPPILQTCDLWRNGELVDASKLRCLQLFLCEECSMDLSINLGSIADSGSGDGNILAQLQGLERLQLMQHSSPDLTTSGIILDQCRQFSKLRCLQLHEVLDYDADLSAWAGFSAEVRRLTQLTRLDVTWSCTLRQVLESPFCCWEGSIGHLSRQGRLRHVTLPLEAVTAGDVIRNWRLSTVWLVVPRAADISLEDAVDRVANAGRLPWDAVTAAGLQELLLLVDLTACAPAVCAQAAATTRRLRQAGVPAEWLPMQAAAAACSLSMLLDERCVT